MTEESKRTMARNYVNRLIAEALASKNPKKLPEEVLELEDELDLYHG